MTSPSKVSPRSRNRRLREAWTRLQARREAQDAKDPSNEQFLGELHDVLTALEASTDRPAFRRGRYAAVYSAPVPRADNEIAVTMTIHPYEERLAFVDGLEIELITADGRKRTAQMGGSGGVTFEQLPVGPLRFGLAGVVQSEAEDTGVAKNSEGAAALREAARLLATLRFSANRGDAAEGEHVIVTVTPIWNEGEDTIRVLITCSARAHTQVDWGRLPVRVQPEAGTGMAGFGFLDQRGHATIRRLPPGRYALSTSTVHGSTAEAEVAPRAVAAGGEMHGAGEVPSEPRLHPQCWSNDGRLAATVEMAPHAARVTFEARDKGLAGRMVRFAFVAASGEVQLAAETRLGESETVWEGPVEFSEPCSFVFQLDESEIDRTAQEHLGIAELDDYLHNLLDGPASARIDAHLADCPACVTACRRLDAIAEAWRAWTGQSDLPRQVAAASAASPGARRFYVSGGSTVAGTLRDLRVENGRLHFTVTIDEHAALPKEAALEVVFLETLATAAVALSERKVLGRVGVSYSVDIPPALRWRLRRSLEGIAWRIRGGRPAD